MMIELIEIDGGIFIAEYALGLEDDQWKIWGIRSWPEKSLEALFILDLL